MASTRNGEVRITERDSDIQGHGKKWEEGERVGLRGALFAFGHCGASCYIGLVVVQRRGSPFIGRRKMEQQQFEPMSVGTIVDKTFRIYRHNFVRFITIVAVVQVPLGLINLLLTAVTYGGVSQEATGRPGVPPGPEVADLAVIMITAVITLLLAVVGGMLCQGALIKSVSESYLGREISVGQAYGFVLPRILTLVGASIMVSLVVGFGFLLLVVPGVIFGLWFYLTTPCIVVEGQGAVDGMSRSRALVSGNLGKVFLVGLLVFLIGMVISMPFGMFSQLCTMFFLRNNVMLSAFVQQFGNVIAQTLAAPIGACAFILLYYDLRIRKEGFDLEMLAQSMSSGGRAGDVAEPS